MVRDDWYAANCLNPIRNSGSVNFTHAFDIFALSQSPSEFGERE